MEDGRIRIRCGNKACLRITDIDSGMAPAEADAWLRRDWPYCPWCGTIAAGAVRPGAPEIVPAAAPVAQTQISSVVHVASTATVGQVIGVNLGKHRRSEEGKQ